MGFLLSYYSLWLRQGEYEGWLSTDLFFYAVCSVDVHFYSFIYLVDTFLSLPLRGSVCLSMCIEVYVLCADFARFAVYMQLLRLLAAVFSLLEMETAALKGAVAAAAATVGQQQQQQQQLLLQTQQQLASPVVLEVGLGVVSLVAKAYLFRERLAKPILADLLLPGSQTTLNPKP